MNSPKVYSYRRFSSGRQARGSSLERQTKLAQIWCQENGLELDESLSLSDLGVSAFKGDNASNGALSYFLKAIEAGKVPKGSILLVESLDRLSRATISEAVGLLTDIVKAGVRVVSMIDGKEWNQETINDVMSFMLSVVLFSRAHEESSTKAKRVSAAFQAKRQAGLPVVSKMHGGGWMQPKADKSGWELIPEKAESVRKVFELAAKGNGGVKITRIATQEGWASPWRVSKNTGRGWEHTGVSRLLRDRRVLGEWQPYRVINGNPSPDGDPVPEYFPRVIDDEQWLQVQAALSSRTGPKRIRGIHADIFAGLLYCECGERMERKAPSGRGNAIYYCLGRKSGRSNCRPMPEAAIIDTFFSHIGAWKRDHFDDSTISIRERLSLLEEKHADATSRVERIVAAIEEGGAVQALTQRLKVVEEERESARAELQELRERLAMVGRLDNAFTRNLVEKAFAAVKDKSAAEDRYRIAQTVASLVLRMRVMTYQTKTVYLEVEMHYPERQGGVYKIDEKYLQRAKRRDAGKGKALSQD